MNHQYPDRDHPDRSTPAPASAGPPSPEERNPVARAAEDSLQVQTALSSRKHFEVLDGLRGVAAIAVVLFHTYNGGGIVRNGPLAVDLFFILSGFVIGYSYDEKLHAGMPRWEFVRRRIIRLYPMVLLGAGGGIILALAHKATNPSDAHPLHAILTSGALSLFSLPYLVPGLLGAKIFSFNPPLWSLFFELVANFAYVAIFRRLSIAVLIAAVLVSILWIGLLGPLGGSSKDDFVGGFPRVIAGFFGGVLLFKLWRQGRLPRLRINFLVLSVAVLVTFLWPSIIGGWAFAIVYAVYLIVIIAASAASSSRFDAFYALLGRVSYPLYLTHWLTLYMFTYIGMRLHLMGDNYTVIAVTHFLAAPLIAYAIAIYYETPFLVILRDRLVPPRTPRLKPV